MTIAGKITDVSARVGLIVCVLATASACGEETTEAAATFSTGDSPSIEITVPAEVIPVDSCFDSACCETKLGIESGACISIEVAGGHCQVVVMLDGTFCEGDGGTGCGGAAAMCQNGQCQAGAGGLDCSAMDVGPCEEAWCDDDACAVRPLADGISCSDGDICNGDETCNAADCVAGTPPVCDNDGPCTVRSCDSILGCVTEAQVGKPCSDSNACTHSDACNEAGECESGNKICQCESDAECGGKGDPCVGTLTCAEGFCEPTGQPLDCDDANPCTSDTCVEGVGCANTPTDGACDDGVACTVEDACDPQTGGCAGTNKDCDDDDPCTDGDSCDSQSGDCVAGKDICTQCTVAEDCPQSSLCGGTPSCVEGQCVVSPSAQDCGEIGADVCHEVTCDELTGTCVQTQLVNGIACDDGDACSTDEACLAGACDGGIVAVCNDQNPCTSDSCDASSGCVYSPTSGDSCDDSNACTTDDACIDGSCSGQTPVVCDDSNPCTEDLCDSGLGCESTITPQKECSDGDDCTVGDVCGNNGDCVGGANTCDCAVDADCDDDGNLCNGVPACVDTICKVDVATVVVCAAAPAGGCTTSVCEPQTGVCAPAPSENGTPCDDADACTGGDLCVEGDCSGSGKTCDDGNPCTADSCDAGSGCVYTPTDDPCDDGNACTTDEACQPSGECASGLPVDCNDGNLCTADTCLSGSGCKYSPAIGLCTDGNPCTTDDFCLNSLCTGTPKQCDSGSACLESACDDASGACAESAVDCSDGSECTMDSCDPAAGCMWTDVACTSDDPCVVPTCDPEVFGGCVETNTTCDDSNACTVDACDGTGECTYSAVVCDDSDGCTVDSCGQNGCVFEPKDCSDNDACTTDACTDGVCTSDAIDCDDGSLCTADACGNGDCAYLTLPCDDNDPCTTDACDPQAGCQSTDKVCDDAVACTVDSCSDGACVFTPFHLECNDDNACTVDTCLANGCDYEALSGEPCSDGDACTDTDVCDSGTCQPGEYSCGPCAGLPDGAVCDDENAATSGDFCLKNKCAGFLTHVGTVSGAAERPGLGHVTYSHGAFHVTGSDIEIESNGVGLGSVTERGWVGTLDGDTVTVVPASIAPSETWTALTTGLAVSDGGRILQHDGTGWEPDNWVQTAFDAAGAYAGLGAAFGRSTADGGLYFLSGRDNDATWILRCSGGAANCAVDTVTYQDFESTGLPRAMNGWTSVNAVGVSTTELVTLADFPTGNLITPFYNDSVARSGTGPNGAWSLDHFDQTFGETSNRDVAGTDDVNAWWVGTAGLMRTRAATAGQWTELNVVGKQEKYNFNGVWVDENVVLVAATKVENNNDAKLRLMVHNTANSATDGKNYEAIVLMDVTAVECAGAICPNFGDQAASIQDVWFADDTLVITGWIMEDGVQTSLLMIRKI